MMFDMFGIVMLVVVIAVFILGIYNYCGPCKHLVPNMGRRDAAFKKAVMQCLLKNQYTCEGGMYIFREDTLKLQYISAGGTEEDFYNTYERNKK